MTCAVCQRVNQTAELLGTLGRTLSRHPLVVAASVAGVCLRPADILVECSIQLCADLTDQTDCWHRQWCCLYCFHMPDAEFLHRNMFLVKQCYFNYVTHQR